MKVLVGSAQYPRRRITLRLLWEPRDAYIGVFWNRVTDQVILSPGKPAEYPTYLVVYACIIPCLPLCIAWRIS